MALYLFLLAFSLKIPSSIGGGMAKAGVGFSPG